MRKVVARARDARWRPRSLFAATAPAAKHATVTASKSVAKGCHTKFVGNRQHTDVVRARVDRRGPGPRPAEEPRRLGRRRLRRQDEARGGRLGRLPRQRGRRGLRHARASACWCRRAASPAVPPRRAWRCRSSPSRRPAASGQTQIVDVSTPTRADKRRLQTLGLDLTEHGDANSIEVVLYGEQDAQKLRTAKFQYTVRDRGPRQARRGQPQGRPALRAPRRRAAARCRAGARPTATWPTTSSS